MPKLIADSHYDIGGYREVYEDRVKAQGVKTAGGLKLTVAAVADGVGGENKGERAAQTALDALYGFLDKSKEKEVPELLVQAVQFANKAVFQLQRETGGASTTLAVAAVDESTSRLYIANAGDSRIYLCRNQKLTQLTIDHSWATVMVWQGKVSPEAAREHPRANVLMRALGPKEQLDVDLGFYVGTTEYDEANTRGREGLPLQSGDAVLVCSDGLIKDSPKTGEPLITTEEILRTVNEKEGKKAVQELVSFALGRGSDDNISAALIQMPDRWRSWRAKKPMLIAGAVILGLAAILSLVIFVLAGTQKKLQTLAQKQTATEIMAKIIGSYTPTPSETPTASKIPTASKTPQISPSLTLLPSAQVVALVINGVVSYTQNTNLPYQPMELGEPVSSEQGLTIRTSANSNVKLRLSDGSFLYLGQDTNLVIESLADPAAIENTVLSLEQGMLLVETQNLSVKTPAGQSAGILGGLMGVQFLPTDMQFRVGCLEGSCTVSKPDQIPIVLKMGQDITSKDWVVASTDCQFWKSLASERVKCKETPTPETTSTLEITATPTGYASKVPVSTSYKGSPTPTKVKPKATKTSPPKPTNTPGEHP
jgi:serine/threonine protein phosphatase PrpC